MRLRRVRTDRRLTVDEVANEMLCSATKISRIETGARRVSLRDVRDLCRLYKLGESETAELLELARDARQPGWWTQYADLNLSPRVGLEDEAVSITEFSMYAIPALLQTEEYAEALYSNVATNLPSAVLNMQIEALQKRQGLLERNPPPRYRALLDEAVLHRRVRGRSVMVAQLEKILYLTNAGQVRVQIIPFTAGAHGSTDSNFEILEFDREIVPPVVFIEGLAGNLYQEQPAEVKRYRDVVDHLRDKALSARESLILMNKLRVAYAES
jgi:transcriptional regulator with XRE-family HTH domain